MRKPKKITKTMQKVATDILTEIRFCHDMGEVVEAYDRVFKQYNLCSDPFTGLPCTTEEYYKNVSQYEKQAMIEMYGHCDGLY